MRTSTPHQSLLLALSLVLAVAPLVPARGQQPLNAPRNQQEWPRFEAAVEVVRIQVVVEGAGGDFVPGLESGDFALRVNGELRPVVDVLEMSASRPASVLAEAAAEAPAADRRVPVGAHRQFLIFLDLTDPSRASFRNARAAARDFIEDTVQSDDRLGLALYSASTGLIMAVPFTSDHQQVQATLESLSGGRLAFGVTPANAGVDLDDIRDTLGGDLADLVDEVERSRYALVAEGMVEGLQDLANTLRVVQGRKHVLFFSRGIDDQVFELSESRGPGGFVAALGESVEALRAADAVLYTLQPDMLRGISDHDPSNMQSTRRLGSVTTSNAFVDRNLLYRLAEDTGGDSYWFRHRLQGGMREIEERSRRYYAVAFQMRSDDPPRSEIEVTVNLPGAAVRAPTSVSLPAAFASLSAMQRAMRLASALELGEERNDLALAVSGYGLPRRGDMDRLAVILQVPGSELAALAGERRDARVELEILGLVIGADGTVFDVFQGRAATGDIRTVTDVAPLRYVNEIRVPFGSHHVKILVRETGTDAMTVRSLRVDTRPVGAGGPSVAGPLPVQPASVASYLWGRSMLTGRSGAENGAGEGAAQYPLRVQEVELSPDLDDVVSPADTRDFLVRVDGLTQHPFNRNVEWSLRLEVIGRGGRVVTIEDWELLVFDDSDPTSLAIVLRVPFGSDLEIGPNELALRALDRLTGAVAEGRWNFTVLPR